MSASSIKNSKIFKIALTAMFSAISLVLFVFLEIPVGMEHLKIDFSDIPALVGAIIYGPLFGIAVELIKNLLALAVKGIGTQMGFGNIMNFIVGCAFIVPFSFLFRKLRIDGKPNKRKIIYFAATSIAGVCSIVITGIGANYVITPLFFKYFLNTEITKELLWTAIWSATALNLIKGVMLSLLAYPLTAAIAKRLGGTAVKNVS